VSRVVIQLKSRSRGEGVDFVIKDHPKDKEWRQLRLSDHLLDKLKDHIAALSIGPDDLLFEMRQSRQSRRRTLPEQLPDPDILGFTEPNKKGRSHRHGTETAYGAGRCRCQHCRNAVTSYRAARPWQHRHHGEVSARAAERQRRRARRAGSDPRPTEAERGRRTRTQLPGGE
jgi:hypothetical protein